MFPDIRKRPWQNLDIIIIGFLYIVDGLITVMSLGFHLSSIEVRYVCWRSKRMVKERMLKERIKKEKKV